MYVHSKKHCRRCSVHKEHLIIVSILTMVTRCYLLKIAECFIFITDSKCAQAACNVVFTDVLYIQGLKILSTEDSRMLISNDTRSNGVLKLAHILYSIY